MTAYLSGWSNPMQVRRIFPISLALTAILAGCASPVSTNIQPSAANVAKYNDLSDISVVAALENNLKEARTADMPFLAPHYFKEAAQVLSECQSQLGNKPRDMLVKNAARGDAILEKGRAVMAIVKYRFAQELEVRARLDALEAAKTLPKDYEKVMDNLSRLIEGVEREQPGNIDQQKEALLKAMLDLEVHAVQEGALHEAEAINAASKKKDAERQAPVTYAEALRTFQDAKKQIAAAPHDTKLVQAQGAQALFAARHASQVNERVATLQTQLNFSSSGGAGVSLAGAAGGGGSAVGLSVGGGGSASVEKATLEKIVLQEEERLHEISDALKLRDLRDLALEKQVAELKREAAELAGSNKGAAMQDLEARLKSANEATQQVTAQLAARDKQLKEQSAQLADKDAQISALNAKLAAKPAPSQKSAKRKAEKTQQP
jgi:hypothetical protein